MASSLRPLSVFPITTRTLEVLRVADASPGMRRVTLGGPELSAHTADNGFPVAAFRSDGFDDEFKIILRHPDAEHAVGPTQSDGVLTWPRGHEHLLFRTYTVRRWDAEAGEIDIDFVRHGVGPATSWASHVQPGDRVQIAGPKMSALHPTGADWVLIAGDETALPAIARWLDEWPAGARAQVFIEVAETSHRQELPSLPGVEVTWLVRDGAEPGSTTLLFDAIRAADWWEGTVFAWVAGETLSLVPIRRWLRGDRALPKEQVEVTGYWRRQPVVLADGASEVQDLVATEDVAEQFHELGELLPAMAVRIAATVGLARAFDGDERTAAELAAATGADATGLTKLLRYLLSVGLVDRAGDAGDGSARYRLTDLGRELEDDEAADELSLDGYQATRELGGALALASAVRRGTGDFARWYGVDWQELTTRRGSLLDRRVADEAEDAEYVVSALVLSEAFGRVKALHVRGRGAGTIASALVAEHPELRATILAAPSELHALSQLHQAHERVANEPTGPLSAPTEPADAVLFAGATLTLPDADAVFALRAHAEQLTPGGRVLVFERVLDPARADEHDYEQDLIEFALTGGGVRSDQEMRRIFSDAGLHVAHRSTVGWGYTLYELLP